MTLIQPIFVNFKAFLTKFIKICFSLTESPWSVSGRGVTESFYLSNLLANASFEVAAETVSYVIEVFDISL